MLDARIDHSDPMTVAFIDMQGPYEQIPEAMGRLYGWTAQHGLQPGGMPRAVYFTPPDEITDDGPLWELQAPLAADAPDQGPDESGLGIKHLPGATHAVATHLGPYDTLSETYDQLGQWVVGHGLTMAGPPEEIYLSDPDEVPPEKYVTEIRFPVQEP